MEEPLTALEKQAVKGLVHPGFIGKKVAPIDYAPESFNPAAISVPISQKAHLLDYQQRQCVAGLRHPAQLFVANDGLDARVLEHQENKELLAWSNRKLLAFGLTAEDLGQSWKDPLLLLGLANSFDDELIDMENATDENMLSNVQIAIDYFKDNLNVGCTFDAQEFLENPEEESVAKYLAAIKKQEGRTMLLSWLNKQINPYHVEARDLSKSFRHPNVLSALVKSFLPGAIDLATVRRADAVPCLENAMNIAEQKMNVVRNMSAQAMADAPDEDMVANYVEDFREYGKKQELLRWVNSCIAPHDFQVSNFSSDWMNPQILSSVVEHFVPGSFNIASVSQEGEPASVADMDNAIRVAKEKLGITANITAQDMANDPIPTRVVEYMDQFKALSEQRTLLAWTNGKIKSFGQHIDSFENLAQPQNFGALVNTFEPEGGLLDLDNMSEETAVNDIAEAMEVADVDLGIAPRMSPIDMVEHGDASRIAGYVSDFRALERKQELLSWVNARTKRYGQLAENFTSDWQDPKLFTALVKSFHPALPLDGVGEETPIQYLQSAINVSEKELKLPSLMAPDLMINRPDEEVCYQYIASFRDRERKIALLQWLNSKIRPFGCVADNFTSSFQDPRTISALVKSFRPEEINLTDVSEDSALRDIERAMGLAEDRLKITPLMGPSVMLNQPEEELMYAYIHSFRLYDDEQKLLQWMNDTRLSQFGARVEDFEKGFQNPMVITGLVKSFVGDSLKLEVGEATKIDDINRAMAIGEEEIGIEPTCTPEVMAVNPDKSSNYEYVSKFKEKSSKDDLLAWLNSKIAPFGQSANDLSDSFKDPRVICSLVKHFAPADIDISNVDDSKALQNVEHAMEICEEKVQVERTMSAQDMLEDPEEDLVAEFVAQCRDRERFLNLKSWVNEKIHPFSLEIENFTSSFKDPKVICALIESFKPDSFVLADITSYTAVADVSKAFDIARSKMNIPVVTSPAVFVQQPEEEEVMSFMSALQDYDHKKSLLDWVNSKVAPAGLEANDFTSSFQDPKLLNGVVKAFLSDDINLSKVSAKTAVKDIRNAMTLAEKKLNIAPSISPAAMVDGVEEQACMEYMQAFRDRKSQADLLQWLNNRINVYESDAKDFQESFKDAKVTCSLIKSFHPTLVDLTKLNGSDNMEVLAQSMSIAQQHMNVKPTIDAETMLNNPRSEDIVKYVADFREEERKRSLLDWLNEKIQPYDQHAINFDVDFKNPKVLSALVKSFCPRDIHMDNIRSQDTSRDIEKAMDIAEESLGVDRNMTAKQMAEAPVAQAVADYIADFREAERRRELLSWLNTRIAPYEVNAENFDTSFQDSRVFSALVKSFLPDKVDMKKIRQKNALADIDKFMGLCEKTLDVPRRLTARAMLEEPSAALIMEYIEDFKLLSERHELRTWVNNKLQPHKLEAKEFGKEWSNPKIISCVVKSFGCEINLKNIKDKQKLQHIDTAMTMAEEKLGVFRTMSAKSMAEAPSEAKIVEYCEKLRLKDRKLELLKWLNGLISAYGVEAANFTTSFQNPKVCCALVRAFCPKDVDLDRVGDTSAKKDIDSALAVGERKCKIARPMSAEALMACPSESAIVSYVAKWRAYQEKQQLLEWLNGKIASFNLPKIKNFDTDFQNGLSFFPGFHLFRICVCNVTAAIRPNFHRIPLAPLPFSRQLRFHHHSCPLTVFFLQEFDDFTYCVLPRCRTSCRGSCECV